MSDTYQPYNAYRRLGPACSRCGQAHDGDHPDADDIAPGNGPLARADMSRGADPIVSSEQLSADFIEAVLVKALLPDEGLRRRFLRAVGANTARAARCPPVVWSG